MGIRQLASELNLSVSTISRALNDSDEVSAETRERVRAAALRHGYAPSKSAESLRKGRLDIIGLMLPMRREEEKYTLGVFMTLADGLQSVLTQHGMDLVMYASESWDDEFARLRRIVERRQACRCTCGPIRYWRLAPRISVPITTMRNAANCTYSNWAMARRPL
ncbi:LacI family transcriptional regulator [Paraburkholderia panacisoli]|jgi:DNA-binding LacI/PurR family transcriptional regulator|uniref:LacI family transcriptional regulator n=1 Tax=Paraburkholderia panacisoli TaxID=2603818 RepID=A0A5B0GLN6_9BURK|nr:LacI family DNA-binding transcriptional regulator [Paraburkholderia panacisoli]KAA1003631.1 LacI family transcriptional regulator [Paraburkholderia panacisoli]